MPGGDLDLDWLEARVGRAVGEYLVGRWRERARSVRRGAPLPALLSDARTRARLERMRGESRRAEMLWRWFATAHVESDPAVAAAVRARDSAALVAARNAAAGGDYVAHVRDRDELPAVIPAPPPAGDEGVEPVGPDATVEQVIAGLGALGLGVAGAVLDVALAGPEDAPAAACTFPIDPPRDVRVYVRAPATPRGLRLLAHELGHAAYALGHDPDLPWALRGAPSRAVHEAVAALAERLVGGPHPDAVARQRALAEAEARAYAGDGELTPAMMDDPGAQASYLYAHYIAARLPWAELPRVFGIGASVSVAALVGGD